MEPEHSTAMGQLSFTEPRLLKKVLGLCRLAVGSTKIPATLYGYPTRPGIGSGFGNSTTHGTGLLIKDPTRINPRTRFNHVIHTKP